MLHSVCETRRRRNSVMAERWAKVLSTYAFTQHAGGDFAHFCASLVERAMLAVQRHLLRMLGSVLWNQKDITAELERITAELGEYFPEKMVCPAFFCSASFL